MVGKTGVFDPATRVIDWTVTVQTDGRSFKELYLQDILGKGLEFSDVSTLEITGIMERFLYLRILSRWHN